MGNIHDIYHYRQWVRGGNYHGYFTEDYKTTGRNDNITIDSNLKWKSVYVNTVGCSINIFNATDCAGGEGKPDVFASTFTANKTLGIAYNAPHGKCNSLQGVQATCIKAYRPCIHPEYNFTTTVKDDSGNKIVHAAPTPPPAPGQN